MKVGPEAVLARKAMFDMEFLVAILIHSEQGH
jgi:hypothetical protein